MIHAPRILLLDQDANTRKLLAAVLHDSDGAEILAAAGVADGLAAVAQPRSVDLAVLDPAGAISRGWGLISELRAAGPAMPIMILSTAHSQQSLARAMELGADDYLPKPVDLTELRKAVARLLQERQDVMALPPEDESRRSTLTIRTEEEGMLVEVVAPSGSMHVARFERFVNRLLSLRLNPEECLKLRLALEEVITNAKEWGNRGDVAKLIRMSYCLLRDRVTFRIEDQGEGFDPSAVPDPTLDPLSHVRDRRASGKRVGGWGILLARKSMDEVTYNRKGNIVFLTKYLRPEAGAVDATRSEAPRAGAES